LCREVPVAVPERIQLQGMRFFDPHRFSVLGGKGVQYEWCDPQVYSVLDEQIDVIRAVLLLKHEWMSARGAGEEWHTNRTRYVSKILLFRYTIISSNFIARSFSSFF